MKLKQRVKRLKREEILKLEQEIHQTRVYLTTLWLADNFLDVKNGLLMWFEKLHGIAKSLLLNVSFILISFYILVVKHAG